MNLKNLDYEIVPVHLVANGGEQFSESFSKINPAHRLPVLEHAGKVVSQSVAIIEYLEAIFRESHLYPTTPFERARCRQFIETINADIQPLQNLSVLKKLVQEHSFDEDAKNKWVRHWITLGFESLESLAQETAGKFSVGDQPTAADCFLVPQVFNANRFRVEMHMFPTLQKINNNCIKHPAFIKAHPLNQPDTPTELKN